MTLSNSIQTIAEEVTAYRRALHENPGTCYEEHFANALITEKLTQWGIPFESGMAVTGVVGTIDSGKPGKSIGLRADIDALDILEENNKEHVSKITGKMHGCGHDGHTAILLGVAKYLSDTKNFSGKVHLIFQPAEEGGGGAEKMIEEGLFKTFPCDEVYGLHNWPGLPRGTMGICPGPIMAATDKFSITVKGAGGHAAMPHLTIDPIVIGAHIISTLQSILSRTVDPLDAAVISVTNFNAGSGAHNVIPDTAHISGTIRSFKNETRQHMTHRVEHVAQSIAQSFGAEIEYTYQQVIDATVNDPDATAHCAEVARSIVGADNVNANVEPCMGGEDFGAMLEQTSGAYIWVGQAEDDPESNHNQGLHTPRYDFNDAIIPTAIAYFSQVVERSSPAA